MKLPDEVLKLLGDDATPQRAIESFEAHCGNSHPDADVDADEALGMWEDALAAAAIRECEAKHRYVSRSDVVSDCALRGMSHEMEVAVKARDEARHTWEDAQSAYYKLRTRSK